MQALALAASLEGDGESGPTGTVGLVVESRGTQTDPEVSAEVTMELLRQENMKLFEEGRALQAT